jgi:site-specific DNA-methyltransferase (adenine-specific)
LTVHHADCLDWLRSLDECSVDACVTDPPYGLGKPPPIRAVLSAWLDGERYQASGGGFMGRSWDAFVPGPAVWSELYRVLKPGAHAVVFAGSRTSDVMGVALRLAGFEVRDSIGWTYYSGFPKSANISAHIDRLHGAEREVIGVHRSQLPAGVTFAQDDWSVRHRSGQTGHITAPATPDAATWAGYGTALKPCIEPAWLVRKPLSESSIARNVLRWGTGAVNVDACRFAPGDPVWIGPQGDLPAEAPKYAPNLKNGVYGAGMGGGAWQPASGRWPANLVHFPKASTAEREAGCDGLPGDERRNLHPTVKPIGLMRWLCRLVGGQPGSLVIDPYTGSGTTGIAATLEGFAFEGSELNNCDGPPPQRFVDIARARIAYWGLHGDEALDVYRQASAARQAREGLVAAGQGSLFGTH